MVIVSCPSKSPVVEPFAGWSWIMVVQTGSAELLFGHTDALGQVTEPQIPQRIGMDGLGHLTGKLLGNFAPIATRQIVGGKKLRDSGHIDTIKTGPHDRRAGHPEMNLASPSTSSNLLSQNIQGGSSNNGILDQENSLSFHDFGHWSVFTSSSLLTGAAFDEGSADVAVAE